MEVIIFFWKQAGGILRAMSLSGAAGNLTAWVILALAGGSPLILWGILGIRKKVKKIDLLLIPISAVLTAGLWFMANPTYMTRYLAHGMEDAGIYMFTGVICALVLAWGILRFLGSSERLGRRRLIRSLEILLGIYVVLTAAGLCLDCRTRLWESWSGLYHGNTWAHGQESFGGMASGMTPGIASGMAPGSLAVSGFFLILQAVAEYLPGFLELILFGFVICLLRSCERENFSMESLQWAERLKRWSGRFLGIILLGNAGVNLLQLLFAGYILQGNYRVLLPVWEAVAVLGILLLSRFYLESRRLKEENDGFI